MDGISTFFFVLMFIVVLLVWKGVKIVPQQSAWVVENLGKFDRILEPGMRFLFPFVEYIAYRHSLKEYAMDVQEQTAITRDNVPLILDGVIYLKIIDPKAASYGVSNPIFAITQLAQTTMRSQIGQLTMDQSFEERERLNANIVSAINDAAQTWGIQCMRYEIKNISPPPSVQKAMELQMAAERQKRALILESEGKRQSQINMAEGKKQEIVLQSEAALTDQVNRANGEAQAIIAVADATAQGIVKVAEAIRMQGGTDAVSLKIAEQYVAAFGKLAQTSTTVLLPTNAGDAGSMVAQALSVFESIKGRSSGNSEGPWKKA
jgi:regulator of protease activity HflC (stomatin/prohibitin superfamily)